MLSDTVFPKVIVSTSASFAFKSEGDKTHYLLDNNIYADFVVKERVLKSLTTETPPNLLRFLIFSAILIN